MDQEIWESSDEECLEDIIDSNIPEHVANAMNESCDMFDNFCEVLGQLYGSKYCVTKEEDVDEANATFCWTLQLQVPGGISLTKPLFITFCSVEAKDLVSAALDYMGGVVDMCETGMRAAVLPDLHSHL